MIASGTPIGTCATFVTSRLATGGALSSQADVDALKDAGITGIIDCRAEFDDGALLAQAFAYIWLPVQDDGQPKPTSWFATGLAFALPLLIRPNVRVLAHCAAGVNRGPSMTYCLMRALGWAPPDALGLIKSARPIAQIAYAADADRAILALGYT